LILRVVLGALILFHGIGKMVHGVAPIEQMLQAHGLPPALAYASYAGEVLGPLMLIVGFYARIGALLIAINMLVAFALVHASQLASLNPQSGGWALELQGMYLFTAVALALIGPGRFAVNNR
jgi:putative oxidoreductase